jgi:hypothetical protein
VAEIVLLLEIREGLNMSKAKMEQARELIREKHYSEARSILKTVNHPKAREWLKRLDEIAPSDVDDIAEPDWSSLSAPANSPLIQDAIAIFAQRDWSMLSQSPGVVQMEKKKGTNPWASAILIVILGLLGALIVAIGSATSGKAVATIKPETAGGISVTIKGKTRYANTQKEIDRIAKSVKGVSIATALFLGAVSWILWYLLILS